MNVVAFNGRARHKGNTALLPHRPDDRSRGKPLERGIGLDRGDAASDEEGLQTMQTLGRNMAWLMQRLRP